MTSMELLESLNAVKAQYVLEAHGEEISDSNVIAFDNSVKVEDSVNTELRAYTGRRVTMKKLILVAAIVAAALCLVGFAYAMVKLRDISVGKYTDIQPNPQNPSETITVTNEYISMQGLQGSPEYQATKEWQDFLNVYDIEGAILAETGNSSTGYGELTLFYQIYNQEMYDKLVEIADKYDLKLHSELNVVSLEELYYRVGGSFIGDGLYYSNGYIYENGTLQLDGDAVINGELVIIQLRRAVKGTLDEPVLNIGNAEEYQELQYETSCGEQVILALGADKALIYADSEECFVLVNILAGTEPWLLADTTINMDDLKRVADAIDFTILKNVVEPDMRGDSGSDTLTMSVEEKRMLAYQNVLWDVYYSQSFPGGLDLGYDGYDMSDNKFDLRDIDNDGNEELILVYTTTYMAGMAEIIYDYDADTDSVREQFIEFPGVTHFDNGILKADWSHNQGLAGRVWPYTLYQYNPNEDTYKAIAMVDAWDKSLSDKDYDGNSFPDDVDKDGDGIVYYIMKADEYEPENPVDFAEYQQWIDSYTKDAEVVEGSCVELTLENILNVK